MSFGNREARAFRNNIALLKGIDRHELEEAEIIPAGPPGYGAWLVFLADPIDFVLGLREDHLERFYDILEGRTNHAAGI